MAYQYTTIDGQRVHVTVAANFKRMAAAFKARWGLTLHIREGVRTVARQQYLYDGWIARKPGFNLALHPSSPKAYHVESNPRGPRALDLYDSGTDAGVTRIGSPRSDWLAANAPKFGFKAAGHTFNPREGWHYEFEGKLDAAAPKPKPKPSRIVRLGSRGALVSKVQRKLKTVYPLYAGKLAVDGIAGRNTIAAVREFQRRAGLKVDGIAGRATLAKLGV